MTARSERPDAAQTAATLSRRDALKAGAVGMAWLVGLGHLTPSIIRELEGLAQGRPMTGTRLAGILRAERIRWNTLLAQVGMVRMETPNVEGTWSVKEIVAHLTWYERAVVEGARQVMSGGRFMRPGQEDGGMDERNARIAAESHARPVGDVLAEADATFGHLLAMIEACPNDLLNDPNLLGLPDDIPPWMRVANNSYGHYREHEAAIRAWLAETARSA
ncbi:MAG: hypothetical protein OJF49_003609 [Ktedonobacterales bacterium]|jgi:hypothetical protein|nr:MAG: hypothetical protein OJF49_003609 [Ktedonobacterales bacterium]